MRALPSMGNRLSDIVSLFNPPFNQLLGNGLKPLWRPMLYASLGLHGLLVLLPMGGEASKEAPPKPKVDEPVKLARLAETKPSLRKKTAVKPKAAVRKTIRPVVKRASTPLAPALPVKMRQEMAKKPVIQEPPKQETPKQDPPKTETPKSAAPEQKESLDTPVTSDETSSPVATKGGGGDGAALTGSNQIVAAAMTNLRSAVLDNPAEEETIPKGAQDLALEFPDEYQPYFFADPAQGLVISKSLKYVEYISRRKPEDAHALLSTELQAQGMVLSTDPVDEYAGLPLYSITKDGSIKGYVSLVPGNFNSYTLSVLWDTLPPK